VTDDEVRKVILDIPSLVDSQGKFVGEETYKRFARSNNYAGPGAFEAAVRRDLLRQKLFEVLTQTAHVSPGEIEQAFREQSVRAAVSYIQLPRTELTGDVQISQDDLQSYYEQHQSDSAYRLPEQRVVDYLLVDKALLRAQLDISDDDLRAYYDEHQDEFTREEQVRARHILIRTGGDHTAEQATQEIERIKARIEGGEDFATVARQVSEDPGSKDKGGELGYFGRGRMTPAFEKAAFDAQPGDLVGPVTTSFGVHLIQVEDRREGGVIPFDEARAAVRSRVAAERVDREAADLAADLRKKLAEGGSEGDVAERMKALADDNPAVRFVTSQPFSQNGLISGLGRAPQFAEAAFSLDAGELAEGVVDTPRGPTVLALQKVIDAHVQSLEEVEPRLRQALTQERAQELAETTLQEAKRQVEEGTPLEQVAADLGLEVRESGEFGANDPIQGLGGDTSINKAALDAALGDVVGPVATAQGAVLMKVTDYTGFDADAFAEQRPQIRQRLARQRATQLMSSIVERRRQEEGVRYDPTLVKEFDLGGATAS
jgi:peptidyl-prolyl cis-trans isomerase D